MGKGSERLETLAKKIKQDIEKGAAPRSEKLPVREFIGWYGKRRRGSLLVKHIRNKMEALQLRTVPDFEFAYIDSKIKIETAGDSPSGGLEDPVHRIGTLAAAHNKPMSVAPDEPLKVATTKMQINDFSQLPVMTGERTVKGIISWKSIGTSFSLVGPGAGVRDCMEESVEEISIDAPLYEAIGSIAKHGYLLVRGKDKAVTGIVTETDLSEQFMHLAGPFLLIGEIEGHLRQLIHGKFTVKEMQLTSEGEGERDISGSADLTFGGYCRLLQNPDYWERLNLAVDRGQFVEHLESVRKIRNDVMHFDPDGLSPEDERMLRGVARFLETLIRKGVK